MGARILVLFCLAMTIGVGLLQSVASGEDGGLVILVPADPYTVEFESDRSAKLELTVRNGSDRLAALEVSLFDVARNLIVIATMSSDPGGVAISVSPGQLTAGDIKRIDVTLQAGTQVDIGKFKGVLVVSATGISPATLNLVGAKAPGQFTVAKTQPSSVTMTSTRFWPSIVPIRADHWMPELWFLDAPHYEVFINGALTEPLPNYVETYLSSDTGGRLRAQLRDFTATSSGMWAVVRLGDTDRAGKYTGKFLLDAKDEKAPTIDITVNVQDFVLWPLLVLILGALAAYQVALYRDQDRPRRIAAAELSNARCLYHKTARLASADEKTWMAGLFRRGAPGDALPAPLSEAIAQRLARVKGQADLDKIVAEIADLSLLVASWQHLREAAQRLGGKAAQHQGIDPNAEAFLRAKSLLKPKPSGFTKAEEAKAFLADLNDQVAAIELVYRTNEFGKESRRLWTSLPPGIQARLAEQNPEVFWRTEVRGRGTKQDLLEANVLSEQIHILRVILAHVIENRHALESQIGRRAIDAGVAPILMDSDQLVARLELVEASEIKRTAIETATPVEWTNPAVILERIRELDKVEFIVSASVAILVSLLLLYIDKNFGSFWNYVSAVLAALGGTLVIKWQLLPWYRTYTSVMPAKV